MATILRSTRFVGEYASLLVRECADASHVQLLMTGGPPAAPEEHFITLNAHEWNELISLPYLCRAECARENQPPGDVREAITFLSQHTAFEVEELASGEAIRLAMNGLESPDEDAIWLDLNTDQWDHFCSLDYVAAQPPEPKEASPPAPIPFPAGDDSSIH